MKLVYIAGAYRAKGKNTVAHNIAAAKFKAVSVCHSAMQHNWYPVTPHLNTAHFEDHRALAATPDEYWLSGTLEMMKRCDAVLLITRHSAEKSAGTAAEVAEAEKLGIPVFYNFMDFYNYAKDQS